MFIGEAPMDIVWSAWPPYAWASCAERADLQLCNLLSKVG
jgi:hypothetical protein